MRLYDDDDADLEEEQDRQSPSATRVVRVSPHL